jgi:hypothetical protein
MKQMLAVMLVLAVAVTAWAQSSDEAKLNDLAQSNSLGIKPATSPFSLLDLSRLQYSHSYSISFFSGGGYSGSVGMLNSMMFYELSSKFTLGFNLRIAHDIGATWSNGDHNASVFPGFWLDFHPSDRFRMSISVQRYPSMYDPYAYRRYIEPHYWSPY